MIVVTDVVITELEFEWDENKNQINIRKHGISFEVARTIFDGNGLSRIDDRFDYGEVRRASLGLLDGVLVLYVVHTERAGKIRLGHSKEYNILDGLQATPEKPP